MGRITVAEWKNIPSGQKVRSGFGYELTAPNEEGIYTLYELTDNRNNHCGWQWEKQ